MKTLILFLLVFVIHFSIVLNERTTTDSNEIPQFNSRIVGGQDATINEFSYLVSVQSFRIHICGGVIINEMYILTAGHCITTNKQTDVITIRSGSNFTTQLGTRLKVCKFIHHGKFNASTMVNDLCILQLCEPLVMNANIKPAILPKANLNLKPGTTATVIGWGTLSESSKKNSISLKKVDLFIEDNINCGKKLEKKITASQVCASFPGGGKDSCYGDSGGPMVYKNTLVALVSHGHGCAVEGLPGVYTNVAKYLDWITLNTKLAKRHWYDAFLPEFSGGTNRSTNNNNLVVLVLVFCLILL